MKKLSQLRNKKLFLFDIDGVLKLGNNLIDGALELYDYIDSIGGKSIFITNNSTKSLKDYVSFFKKLGFNVDKSNFMTALSITVQYLKENHYLDLIYVVGTKSLIKELKSSKLNITNKYNDNVNVVLVCYDNEFNYDKAIDASKILQTKKVTYLATNPDLRCPVEYGFVPDCGAITKFIELATDMIPKYLGKPSPEMVNIAIKNSGFSKEETLVVGDRLYTDIACGINANVDTCIVFTGEAKKNDLRSSNINPTYEFETVKELYLYLKNNY